MKKIKCKNCGNINLLQISNDRDLYKCKHCGVEFTVELRFENLTFFGIPLLAAMIGTKLADPLDLSIEFISILVTVIFAVIYVWVRPYKMQIRNKTKKINDD